MKPPIFIFDSKETRFPQPVDESLGRLGYQFINGMWRDDEGHDKLDWPDDTPEPTDLGRVGYHRCIKSGPLYWHQFWLWYLYNPKNYPLDQAGWGRHKGDWEFVQIGVCGPEDHILITCSQHHTGGKREAWMAETSHDGRPIIYVARGSHANYFAPVNTMQDIADGNGLVYDDIVWRDFGKWINWKGQWGTTRGEGNSPDTPSMQGSRWNHPHLFHSQAR